jgi:uncharacterized protein (TIGR00369 family)
MEFPDFSDRFDAKMADALIQERLRGPYARLVGLQVESFTPGTVVCSLEVTDDLESGVGAVHGGAIASLVDHSLSLAVYPLVERGKWVATMEMKINYLGSVRKGTVKATGRVVSLRRQIAVTRVDVENEGRLVAVGQGTLYIRDR